jgi:hypothetical protein
MQWVIESVHILTKKCTGKRNPAAVASTVRDKRRGRTAKNVCRIIIDAKGNDGARRAVAMSLVR